MYAMTPIIATNRIPTAAPRSSSPEKLYSSINIESGRESLSYRKTTLAMSRTAAWNDSTATVINTGETSGSSTRQ